MTIQQSYFKMNLPIEKVIKFYNENLKGTSLLFDDTACHISQKIDDYFEMSAEKQRSSSTLFEFDKKKVNEDCSDYEDSFKRINTKIACAMILEQLRWIEKYQDDIEERIHANIPDHLFNLMYDHIRRPYDGLSLSAFDDFKSCSRRALSIYYMINRWKIEDNFRIMILPEYLSVASMYCSIFRVNDESKGNCLSVIILILLLVTFGALAACS